MINLYVLDDRGRPVPEPDLLTWARWHAQPPTSKLGDRQVGVWRSDGDSVTTVFIGCDNVMFETYVHGGEYAGRCWRYHDREAAHRGHCAIVRALLSGHQPPDELPESRPT